MLTKAQHIDYWILTGTDDIGAVEVLFEGRKYVQALFFTHLALEKILKAHWVKDNVGNTPPKIHNLISLYKQTRLKLPDDELAFLLRMNTFQMEGRYPEYISMLHKTTTKSETQDIISQAKILFQCLRETLP